MEFDSRAHPYKWWDDRATISDATIAGVRYDKAIFANPKSIYAYFDSKIYGCDDYKRKMAVAIFNAIHKRIKTNFLIIGESGCGKTELARVLKEAYPNTVIFDSSNASPKSFKGNNSITDCLLNINDTQPAFVFIDEFDKCLFKGSEIGSMLESELLKLAEGAQVFVGDDKHRKVFDTALVSFIFMGTFAQLKKERSITIGFNSSTNFVEKESPISKDDIVDSGIISNEFIGRLNGGIIQLPAMTPDKVKAMLSDSRYSPVSRLERQYNLTINLTPNRIDELANLTPKYGVRGIYAELQEKIGEAMFENSDLRSVTI